MRWWRSKSKWGNPPHIALYVIRDTSNRSRTASSEVTWKILINSVVQIVKQGLQHLFRVQCIKWRPFRTNSKLFTPKPVIASKSAGKKTHTQKTTLMSCSCPLTPMVTGAWVHFRSWSLVLFPALFYDWFDFQLVKHVSDYI